MICETDILAWGAERINVNNGSDVECVDLLLRIRDELVIQLMLFLFTIFLD